MKKIVFFASVLFMMAACNKKPGGNHQVIPVFHEPVEVPSHDDHGTDHSSHETHQTEEATEVALTTTDSATVKQDTIQAGH